MVSPGPGDLEKCNVKKSKEFNVQDCKNLNENFARDVLGYCSLRASTCRSELTFDTVIPVNIGQISMLDQKISSLAPPVLALELIKIYISNERAGLHCRF